MPASLTRQKTRFSPDNPQDCVDVLQAGMGKMPIVRVATEAPDTGLRRCPHRLEVIWMVIGAHFLHLSGKEVTNARVRAVLYGSEELSQGRLP